VDLSIVIPCYNEGGSLDALFDACRNALASDISMEVVFVDNGSTDDSEEQLARLLSRPENQFGRLVSVGVNQGYGHGIMTGVRAARGDVIAWTHADLQTDPGDVVAAYRSCRTPLENGTVIVKGRRKGRGIFDTVFTAGMSLVASTILGQKLSDINAQPKIFHRSFLNDFTDAPEDFSLDAYFLYVARTKGIPIYEYPVIFADRQFGEAKGGGSLKGKVRIIRRTLAFLRKLRREIREGVR
jgi:glycosyltransferase involved in cell wall biosynthesis